MAVQFSRSSFLAVHRELSSFKRSLDSDAYELQELIFEGCASDIDKADFEELKSQITVVTCLLKFLNELGEGDEQ